MLGRLGRETILSALAFLGGASGVVRAHHERWDGTGYPDQLAGEDIPLGARILAVADAFVAMTSERPYRAALRPAEAMGLLMTPAPGVLAVMTHDRPKVRFKRGKR